MAKRLFLVLTLILLALPARAAWMAFDDPAMSTHPFIADSVSRSASWNTPVYSCPSGSAAFFINITAGTTLLIQLAMQIQDPATGTWFDAITHAALTGTGSAAYIIGAASTTGATATSNTKMPPVFRIRMYHNNANAATYTVGGFCY